MPRTYHTDIAKYTKTGTRADNEPTMAMAAVVEVEPILKQGVVMDDVMPMFGTLAGRGLLTSGGL